MAGPEPHHSYAPGHPRTLMSTPSPSAAPKSKTFSPPSSSRPPTAPEAGSTNGSPWSGVRNQMSAIPRTRIYRSPHSARDLALNDRRVYATGGGGPDPLGVATSSPPRRLSSLGVRETASLSSRPGTCGGGPIPDARSPLNGIVSRADCHNPRPPRQRLRRRGAWRSRLPASLLATSIASRT